MVLLILPAYFGYFVFSVESLYCVLSTPENVQLIIV